MSTTTSTTTDILTFQVKDELLTPVLNGNPFYIDVVGSVNYCVTRCGQEIDECNSVSFDTMTNYGKILVLTPNKNTNNSKCNIKLAFDTENDTTDTNGTSSYEFVKAFITVPSLHKINGTIYDMETFLVFSSTQKNGQTLYVILCTVYIGTDTIPNDWKLLNYKLMNELLSDVPDIYATKGIKGKPNPVDLNTFIPTEGNRNFYDYTHPKNTSVNIRVFQSPMVVSNNVLTLLKSKLTTGDIYTNFQNAIQTSINPINGLYFFFSEDMTDRYKSFSVNNVKENEQGEDEEDSAAQVKSDLNRLQTKSVENTEKFESNGEKKSSKGGTSAIIILIVSLVFGAIAYYIGKYTGRNAKKVGMVTFLIILSLSITIASGASQDSSGVKFIVQSLFSLVLVSTIIYAATDKKVWAIGTFLAIFLLIILPVAGGKGYLKTDTRQGELIKEGDIGSGVGTEETEIVCSKLNTSLIMMIISFVVFVNYLFYILIYNGINNPGQKEIDHTIQINDLRDFFQRGNYTFLNCGVSKIIFYVFFALKIIFVVISFLLISGFNNNMDNQFLLRISSILLLCAFLFGLVTYGAIGCYAYFRLQLNSLDKEIMDADYKTLCSFGLCSIKNIKNYMNGKPLDLSYLTTGNEVIISSGKDGVGDFYIPPEGNENNTSMSGGGNGDPSNNGVSNNGELGREVPGPGSGPGSKGNSEKTIQDLLQKTDAFFANKGKISIVDNLKQIITNKLNTYFIVILLVLFLIIFIFTCWIFNQMRILNSNPCHPSIDQLNSVTTGLNFLPFIVSLVLAGVFAYLLYNNLEASKGDTISNENKANSSNNVLE
jgi:carbonic anhydrase